MPPDRAVPVRRSRSPTARGCAGRGDEHGDQPRRSVSRFLLRRPCNPARRRRASARSASLGGTRSVPPPPRAVTRLLIVHIRDRRPCHVCESVGRGRQRHRMGRPARVEPAGPRPVTATIFPPALHYHRLHDGASLPPVVDGVLRELPMAPDDALTAAGCPSQCSPTPTRRSMVAALRAPARRSASVYFTTAAYDLTRRPSPTTCRGSFAGRPGRLQPAVLWVTNKPCVVDLAGPGCCAFWMPCWPRPDPEPRRHPPPPSAARHVYPRRACLPLCPSTSRVDLDHAARAGPAAARSRRSPRRGRCTNGGAARAAVVVPGRHRRRVSTRSPLHLAHGGRPRWPHDSRCSLLLSSLPIAGCGISPGSSATPGSATGFTPPCHPHSFNRPRAWPASLSLLSTFSLALHRSLSFIRLSPPA